MRELIVNVVRRSWAWRPLAEWPTVSPVRSCNPAAALAGVSEISWRPGRVPAKLPEMVRFIHHLVLPKGRHMPGDAMTSACPCSGGLSQAMRGDLDRYLYQLDGTARLTAGRLLRVLVLFPGLWALVAYRLTHQCLHRVRPRFLGKVLAGCFFAAQRIALVLFGIEIDSHAHIGTGLFVNHFGGIVIGPSSIGANCNISHGVTLGRSSLTAGTAQDDVPTLGDRVWLGPGAIVAGPITLGDDVTVAGNSLVTHDVPARGVAKGVPAKIVSLRGSFHQVAYPGMADDPGRSASLAAAAAAHDVVASENSS